MLVPYCNIYQEGSEFYFKNILIFFSFEFYIHLTTQTCLSLQKGVYIMEWSFFWRDYFAWNAKD